MIARYIVLVSIVISVAAMACASSGPVPALTQTPEIDIEATVETLVDKRVAEIFERILEEPTIVPRSPVTSFVQYRIDVTNDDTGCTSYPADIKAKVGQRMRFAIQLVSERVPRGSQTVTYSIPGLELSGSGGAFLPGVTSLELHLSSGNRTSYDFDVANAGSFDILCDGVKIGTFTSS